MEELCRDNDRPYGLYGEVYDRATGANLRRNTQPMRQFAKWECEAIDNLLLKIHKDLKIK